MGSVGELRFSGEGGSTMIGVTWESDMDAELLPPAAIAEEAGPIVAGSTECENLRWFFRCENCVKPFWQMLQLYGFSPVWTRACLWSFEGVGNLFPQKEHSCRFTGSGFMLTGLEGRTPPMGRMGLPKLAPPRRTWSSSSSPSKSSSLPCDEAPGCLT